MKSRLNEMLTVICSAALVTACFYGCTLKKDPDPPMVNGSQLKHTVMAPYIDAKIQKGQNLIYCSTFQLAWNGLKNNIIKEDIRVEGEPDMVDYLNSSPVSKNDLSEDCYVAEAGFNKDNIIKKINNELKKKFGKNAVQLDKNELQDPDDILAYAYLNKVIRFRYFFENLQNRLKFQTDSGAQPVGGFGIGMYERDEGYDKMITQVDIIDYKNDNNFIIKLHGENPNDEIILAMVSQEDTLLHTVQTVENRIKTGSKETIDDNDELWIPTINININNDYRELQDKHIENSKFTDYFIKKAEQSFRFRLNKGGAETESDAKIDLALGMTSRQGKKMIFDKPFLIYLKEKDKTYPYAAMWIDNTELMTQEK